MALILASITRCESLREAAAGAHSRRWHASRTSAEAGGRQKGTPNKNRAALLAKLDDAFPSYDRLLALVEIAQDPETDLSMRVDCHKALASYIYPKMRTTESVDAS